MKTLRNAVLAATLATCTLPAFASGPLDGIYQCTMSGAGQSYSLFMTIHGKSDGQSLFVIAAVGNNSPFKGFGFGPASSTGFTGTTDSGQSFTVTATGSDPARTLSGSVGVKVNNQPVTATANCQQLY